MYDPARVLAHHWAEIPATAAPDGRAESITITIRSTQTLAEMVAEQGWDLTDPDTRWTYGQQIDAYEANPQGHWEQSWRLTAPARTTWTEGWTVEDWARWEGDKIAQVCPGFLPVLSGMGWDETLHIAKSGD